MHSVEKKSGERTKANNKLEAVERIREDEKG
jgi:hypothetical protein